jgi:hypothetical protein
MDQHMDQYPIVLQLVRAFEVVAESLKLPLSDRILGLFRRSSLAAYDTTDVPVAFILPVPLEIVKLVQVEGGPGKSQIGVKVEDLIRK